MKLAIFAIAFLIVGCAHTEYVYVPTPIPCITDKDIPKEPIYHFSPPYKNVFTGTRDLMGDRVLMKSHINSLTSILNACKK